MPRILVKKTDGVCSLKAVEQYIETHKDGFYLIEVKLVRSHRSNLQNSWLWGCIYPMLLQGLNDAGWEFTDVEQVHEYFKTMLTNVKVINHNTGEIVEFSGSTTDMSTVEFSTYCDKLREYAAEYLNIDIPDPDINWRNN